MRMAGNESLLPEDRVRALKKSLSAEATRLLEKTYGLDMILADRIVAGFFREGYLPAYYFLSHNAEEITAHVFVTTQLLSANTEFLTHESGDGRVLTYFVNVGRDFPGRLARIIEENILMDISSFSSVKTGSGIRIMTLERPAHGGKAAFGDIRGILESVMRGARKDERGLADRFIESLPANYLNEEMNIVRARSRIRRHLELYEKAMNTDGIVALVESGDTGPDCLGSECEQRVSIAARSPGRSFVLNALRVFERHGVNLHRSYFDTFETPERMERVAVLTLYTADAWNLGPLAEEIRALDREPLSGRELSESMLSRELEGLMRVVSAGEKPGVEMPVALERLRVLSRENAGRSGPEKYNFLLNSITDFFAAAQFLEIDTNDFLVRELLRFESLGEFYVPSQNRRQRRNLPGYRFAHNMSRGPGKGGLRLDPIVRFDEMCALSFMMTWKTARTRILFGGAKGGLVIRPVDFADNRLDFNDTLTSFGRSLFLLTGPRKDVPAGDVGCGPEEIGVLFEGFKSALRDLVLVAHGVKKGVTLIGHRVIPLDGAREILKAAFDIDWTEQAVLDRLASSEEYLELVTAAQITGKPRMGIAARTGATGRGLLYGALAMAGRLYLEGRWNPAVPVDEYGVELLRRASRYTQAKILDSGGEAMLGGGEWGHLLGSTYPALLKDKKVIVQGTGKVGGALLRELEQFGVRLVAVGDAGGAVAGPRLDIQEVLREVDSSPGRSCAGARKNVSDVMHGAAEGAAILEMECDILFPCALENVITEDTASKVKAKMVASGGNGTTTSRGEMVLHERGIAVVYDFIANSGGVIASYFEWLRNLAERFRYEARVIVGRHFDVGLMDPYVMPEFRDRIKRVLLLKESAETTESWNGLLRDIIFSAVNDDYDFASRHGISLKTAGFAQAILRVLAARIARMDGKECSETWAALSPGTREFLMPFLKHPETLHLAPHNEALLRLLRETGEC